MKQLKLTGFVIFLFFLTESLNLPTKPQDVDDFSTTQKFIEENVGYITIITFAQYIQKASFEEVEMLAKAMTEYRDQCLTNMTLPQCSKLPNALLEAVCAMEGLPKKHNFSHCCTKVDFERRLCFFLNKKADVGFLPPLPTLDPEVKCQAYKSNSESFLSNYIYEVSRRNPFVFAPTLLTVNVRIEEMIKTCCEEQDKANCFQTKAVPVIQYLKALSSYQKTVCGAFLKFGPQVLKSIYIVTLSQKFPKIEFKELTSLLEDVSSMYDGCCEGDAVQCIRGRLSPELHSMRHPWRAPEKDFRQEEQLEQSHRGLEWPAVLMKFNVVRMKLEQRVEGMYNFILESLEQELRTRSACKKILNFQYVLENVVSGHKIKKSKIIDINVICLVPLSEVQSKVMSHICSKQDSISSKIKECCEKKIPERGECIIHSYKDDRPEELSLRETKFTENKNVCEERNADQDIFMAKFLYEYSRRNQELSTPELLRIAKVYDDLLKECCNAENPPDCYSIAESKFNETTEKSLKMVQRECERFQNLGKNGLKYFYFIRFTKIAPRLSTDELTFLGEGMVTALTTCCTLSEEFACVDNLVDLVLGEICGVNENRTINPAVDHCCKTNFAFRRPCFEALEIDQTYMPPSASPGLFTFHTGLCQEHNEELQRRKDRFLVNLVKLKPELADEALLPWLTEFSNLVDRCCGAAEPGACFSEEGPKLAAKIQTS